MKKTWKKMASLFLSVLLMLSMVVTPAMAAERTTRSGSKDAPTAGTSLADLFFDDFPGFGIV